MKLKTLLVIKAAWCGFIISTASLFSQGSLTPPGAPAPTMKTLDQIEPRTPISAIPFTITTPGSFYLTTNLSGTAGQSGISVLASDVTLDLKGFSLIGVSNSLDGVSVDSASVRNLCVRNGTLRLWRSGVNSVNGANGQFEQLRASDNRASGLNIGPGSTVKDCVAERNVTSLGGAGITVQNGCLVVGCIARENGNYGILAFDGVIIKDCVARTNSYHGILVNNRCRITGCIADANGYGINTVGDGILINGIGCTIKDSTITGNHGDGIYCGDRCMVLENTCDANGGAGIRAVGGSNRIENNSSTGNTGNGFRVDGIANLVIKNSARGNLGGNYGTWPASSNYGLILVGPGANFSSSAAWANFDY